MERIEPNLVKVTDSAFESPDELFEMMGNEAKLVDDGDGFTHTQTDGSIRRDGDDAPQTKATNKRQETRRDEVDEFHTDLP